MVAISGRPVVLLFDSSTHGGTIITGDPIATVNGIPMARVGDLHSCPQFWPIGIPHGVTTIIPIGCIPLRGLLNGRPYALDQDITGCGAQVMATQRLGASKC